MSNDKAQHGCQPLFACIFNKTEPGEKGPSTGSDHGVNLEPAKARAEQWFAAQLSGKEMDTRKREKEWLEGTGKGREALLFIPVHESPAITVQGCPGLSYGGAESLFLLHSLIKWQEDVSPSLCSGVKK